jgi:hypothetical protein
MWLGEPRSELGLVDYDGTWEDGGAGVEAGLSFCCLYESFHDYASGSRNYISEYRGALETKH